MQWEFETGIVKKLYEDQQRKAVQIKVPKMPNKKVQDHHSLTHIPFKSWCEACLAATLKKMVTSSKITRRRTIRSFDFACTFTVENYESVFGEHVKPGDFPNQYGTMLVVTISGACISSARQGHSKGLSFFWILFFGIFFGFFLCFFFSGSALQTSGAAERSGDEAAEPAGGREQDSEKGREQKRHPT